ncbi:pentatricopeptide repeat-containing protein At1g62260, mitochondrial isoform X3 [Hevea brasiliensis]|uniref:pentatricopeptide repeat-containing protein At1g62260, mitochondrial isoform X3 n=1 Tax=Hevea brasiliensis TaxID=3981 RepID=UPI0025DAB1D8|nr:pentatricopeptide repeat-containing protein At1g62260, mitochondrial isoform X3 [Hevea brasiliensis]
MPHQTKILTFVAVYLTPSIMTRRLIIGFIITCKRELQITSQLFAGVETRCFASIPRSKSSFQDLDLYSLNKKISHFTRMGRINEARALFDKIERRNTVTWNSMISGYVKRGEMTKARKLFDEMPKRDIVSWNLMISGYVSCRGKRFVEEGRYLFDKMPERDYVSWNTMISGYAKNGRMDEAFQLFNKMPERNAVSWNAMVTGFLQNGDVVRAIEFFEKIPERDAASLSVLVSGLIQNGELDEAARILFECGNNDGGKEDLVHAYNTLIAGYGQRGRVDEARNLFDQIPFCDEQGNESRRRFVRNVVSWNTMIMCYVKAGDTVSARELFDQMRERDTFSWNTMISGYVHVSNMEEASNLFCKMLTPDTLSWNSMISGYAQGGNMELAHDLFQRMPQKNLISWNIMIAGYEKNEDYKGAIKLFIQMQVEGLVEEGRGIFKSMVSEYGIEPRLEHFASLVDIVGRHGQLQEALDLINSMPFEPDKIVWGALLGASRVHNNVEMARVAAEALMRLEPDSSVPYVLLYNMYADAGQWDNATEVRIMMERKNIKKEAAFSWVDSSK